jgi:hypothetical protein
MFDLELIKAVAEVGSTGGLLVFMFMLFKQNKNDREIHIKALESRDQSNKEDRQVYIQNITMAYKLHEELLRVIAGFHSNKD